MILVYLRIYVGARDGTLRDTYSWRNWQYNSVPMKTLCKLVKCKLIECVYLLPHLLTLHYATKRKVACSITDGVIRLFHWHNLSGSNMALGLTQSTTEMNTRIFFFWGGGGGGKGCRRVGRPTLSHSCAYCLEIWQPQNPGTLWACNRAVQGLSYPTSLTCSSCNF
jgi:hypothetical protein